MKKKKIVIIALILITLIQLVTRIYIGTRKEYIHMDEAYSYGLMNYDALSITDKEDFLNTWHDKEYYLDYFEVNSDEKDDWMAVYENQKNDVHPPLYYLLLRIAASFTIDNFTKWTGIILNCLIFIISNIFIYLIAKKIFKNYIYALLAVLINGFTLIALDCTMYIRMYELTNLNVLIITYLHLKLYEKEELKLKNLLPLGICLIIGGLTHYYYFIFVLALYLIYTYKCIKTKTYKNLIKYNVAVIISASIYLAIFPYCISHVFFGYRGVGSSSSVDMMKNGLAYVYVINKMFFNHLLPILIPIIYLICRKKDKKNVKLNSNIKLLLIPIIVYLLVVIKISPYIESRYIMPIYSVFVITSIYLVKGYLYKFWSNKNTLFITSFIFLIIILSPTLTGTRLDFTFKQHENIAQKLEEKNYPIIYVFNPSNNRFLDDIYLFTVVDNSIVLDSNQDDENIKQVLENQDGNFILICNEGVDEDKIKSYISQNGQNVNYYKRMNACNVYECISE